MAKDAQNGGHHEEQTYNEAQRAGFWPKTWRADAGDSRRRRRAARRGRTRQRADLPDLHVYVFFDSGDEALG